MNTKSLVAFLSLALCCAAPARTQTLEWIQQLGTSERDGSHGASADGLGNVYITGETEGSLEGPNAGQEDAFLAKYDADGMLQWTRQFGNRYSDVGTGISADGLGNIYISGETIAGSWYQEVFISKYDASGTLQWIQQFGTDGKNLYGRDVSADGLGNVYVTGAANWDDWEVFLRKYDASGALQWTRQLNTSDDEESSGVSVDGLGNVYISGWTDGSLGGANAGGVDAFVRKYDASGTLQWTQQLGTSRGDYGRGVSADGLGNVYISGVTRGNLEGTNAGQVDAFLAKYDASGELEWTRQLGTNDWDWCNGVSADGLGNVYISGFTDGSLGGINPNPGAADAFLAKYDASGTLLWTQQLGTSEVDNSSGVSADGLGNVYITGDTRGGSLGGAFAGGFSDAFVAKFVDLAVVPEPSSILLLLAALSLSLTGPILRNAAWAV